MSDHDAGISLAQASALIRSRRTVKPGDMDGSRAVEKGLVMELLENATWAPTHGMTEPWRFKVFAGEARKDLTAALQRVYREVTPEKEFREEKFQKMGVNPLLAPVVIAASMERNGGEKIPEQEEIEAVACAIQNLMLSATAAGLGSFWSSAPVLESRAFGEWLGLREQDRCVGLVYLGWPKEGVRPRSVRKPVVEKVEWA